ncbi:MAG TPA: PDZ domain-containing protein, partial [Candidatus Deferrimicrobiaceae bacterium]
QAEIHVTKLAENAYSLDEATIGQITGNINQLMTNVRLIPYFEGNKSAGYRVAAIRPGSAFEQLGFRGGDVIQQVNNVDLSTPDKMYTIFQNLKDEKKVTVNILRQGQKSSISYEIR